MSRTKPSKELTPQIGTPIKDIPRVGRYGSKYAAVYEAVDALTNGDWLPITFDSDKQARTFQCTVMTHRTRKMEATIRRNVVYLRNQKPSDVGE